VLDKRLGAALQGDTHGVEAVTETGATVALEPVARDTFHLATLERRDRLQRMTVPVSRPSLHLHKRHEVTATYDEIDLTVAETEVALEDHVAAFFEVTGGQSLPEHTQIVRCAQLILP
jgi:hypothetical protein